MVDDFHLPVLVYPQFTDDNVVYDCLDFAPGVVVSVGELQMGDAQRFNLQVLALEPGPHRELLPALPAGRYHATTAVSFRLKLEQYNHFLKVKMKNIEARLQTVVELALVTMSDQID